MKKAIFIDVDGPLIPQRAIFLPTQTKRYSVFDPCATSMLNHILDMDDSIQLVISSQHAMNGYDKVKEMFIANGIDWDRVHKDWKTPRKMSSGRVTEILWWLEEHRDTTHWAAIDDESLDVALIPYLVQCDTYDGFSWRNMLECRLFLGLYDKDGGEDKDSLRLLINYYKRREVINTLPHSTLLRNDRYKLDLVAHEVHPAHLPWKDEE